MHLQWLHYLQLVIAKGSFSEAAREAGVSQPAITVAMQKLEKYWGITLFQKAGRQKVPTPAALVAAQRAGEMQGRLENLPRDPTAAFAWTMEREGTTLRAGMAHAAALLYGPTIERAWRAWEFEGLLRIVAGSAAEQLAALQSHELDLVIAPRPRRYPASGIKRHSLHLSIPAVYARKGHPLRDATSLQDIAHAGWAVAGRAGTAGNVIEEAHRVRGLPAPRILVQCSDYPTLLNFVAHSDLLCVVPHPVLVPAQEVSALTTLRIQEGLPRYEVCLFWHPVKYRRNGKAVAAVVKALKELGGPGEPA